MTRIRRKCPECGKESCTKGDFCQYCGGTMTPIDQEEENLVSETQETEKGGNGMGNLKKLGLVALVLLIAWLIWTNYNNQQSTNSKKTVNDIVATEKDTTATVAAIHAGLDQPSKSWFLAKAGTAISGDVCIFDNDNNSKKTPVYDSQEGTADVIYLTSDTYIWTEWGCYTIENANTQDVTTLINDKLTNGNFNSVRYFNGFNKLGTNTPTIISSKIDASSITLPSLATTTTTK